MTMIGVIDVAEEGSADGWAVVKDGVINVRTVSPTRIAAMVNWIVVELRIPLHNNVPDENIEDLFNLHKGEAQVKPVTITVAS